MLQRKGADLDQRISIYALSGEMFDIVHSKHIRLIGQDYGVQKGITRY